MTSQSNNYPASLADPGSRLSSDLSTAAALRTNEDIWRCVQRGLLYPSPTAIFVAFFERSDPETVLSRAFLGRLVGDAQAMIERDLGGTNTTLILAMNVELWTSVSQAESLAAEASPASTFADVFEHEGSAFVDSGADLWFHIKGDDAEDCGIVFDWLRTQLEEESGWADADRTVAQLAATKSDQPDKRGGKVIGSRFSENLNNATDPISIQKQTIVGFEHPGQIGGSYVLAQRFKLNWDSLLTMSPNQIEDLVGRTTDDVLIPSDDEFSHIKRARTQDVHGDTVSVLRLGLPFGTSPALERRDLRKLGASRRDEHGIYFAGYSNSIETLTSIMRRQNGDEPGFMADRMLANAQSDVGGIFYVPSLVNLGLPLPDPETGESGAPTHPAMDWSRLDRHFNQASPNGYMHYNHKAYLYRMSTMTPAERDRSNPPSYRVLELLSRAFSVWQDSWYFDRTQPEMLHLSEYVERFEGAETARDVMALSVQERGGWAAKILLGKVLVSDEYGFRGRRVDPSGNTYNGADTYHIDPSEILVGAMPRLGLGQGKYLIDFARDDEELFNFFDNLSYASGVGHVVASFQRMLELGIGGLTTELIAQRDAAETEEKQHFYASTVLALEGVADHCRAYSELAQRRHDELGSAQGAERANLMEIRDRMLRLATEAPATFVEAAQLIFTLHSCLHLSGEPTAIGRLDQLLQPFYETDIGNGTLTPDAAQEVIDCFWVKVGEKVLLNRQFVDDHQVFGNLAMGGSSGNYPQGSSINQWIQQVTVGGTIADDSPGAGQPAYNDVTTLCLRAAARLPLNAPCLSLRTRADMPDEVLHEAAVAILSGGAHPILMSDEKLIPGLAQSGTNIGAWPEGGASVAEQSDGKWRSEVELVHARDYAADGCFEPQLSGRSWMSLGGVITPSALEAALNQGKTWQSAGPAWFRGQRVSFTSQPADQLESFDELVDLFFEHLRWIYAKQVDGQIGGFGRMNSVCPAPLLSTMIEGCVEKGLDYYEGGPLYNVYIPCFTGITTVIDSLWAIRKLVFDSTTACTSLSDLVQALRCDWGNNMVEPFVNALQGSARIEAQASGYRWLRSKALSIEKFGTGHGEIDEFGDEIVGRIAQLAVETFTTPNSRTADKMVAAAVRIGTEEHPFGGFQVQPGVGTFENYLDWGAVTGASADGRRSGEPIPSDLSPASSPVDFPVKPSRTSILEAMAAYSGDGVEAMWDSAPTDFNIDEDFPVDKLQAALAAFANGLGSSLMTITCADAATYEAAVRDPEKFDLLRVRMGGWSEFFVTMFPAHQAQHQRRAVQTPQTNDIEPGSNTP